MGKTLSPLRYPGGKSQLAKRVQKLIEINDCQNRIYVEPFAGGFGVGLYLLANNVVDNAVINDYDQHVYHFWMAALYQTDALIELVKDTPISLAERTTQKLRYLDPSSTVLQDGFATLYLNRVNYSGVLFAGPIGGSAQKSQYSIGCRFNKENIIHRIREVGNLSERIKLFNLDANDLITKELVNDNACCFYNIDPPYVIKGKSLYNAYFSEQDHRTFKNTISQYLENTPWIITYDDCDLIREIYADYHIREYDLFHSAHNRARGTELVITNLDDDEFEW
jgi:DNA adenine methylase